MQLAAMAKSVDRRENKGRAEAKPGGRQQTKEESKQERKTYINTWIHLTSWNTVNISSISIKFQVITHK